jgi:hypothetical protein
MMSNTEIETRLAYLETEVAHLKAQLKSSPEQVQEKPWWQEILGSFANDPDYDEAMRLGREYRESLRPTTDTTIAT